MAEENRTEKAPPLWQVREYPIPSHPEFELAMPEKAKVLDVRATSDDTAALLALVNTEAPEVKRGFVNLPRKRDIDRAKLGAFVGAYALYGGEHPFALFEAAESKGK